MAESSFQVNNPSAADSLWARVDRLITNLGPWVPTVTETETDLVSQRVGDYQYVPTIGPCSTNSGCADACRR